MKKKIFLSSIFLVIVIFAIIVYFYKLHSNYNSYNQLYINLLEKLIPSNDENGIYRDICKIKEQSQSPSYQEIAYLISAECDRYNTTHSEKSKLIILQGTEYLLDNSDLDMDGEAGYGLFFAWDAFGDGTVNDEYTSYAITNAAVIDGFLDALETDISLKDEKIEAVIHSIAMTWFDKYFTEVGKGGYVWYSNRVSDNIDCPNVSAVWGG